MPWPVMAGIVASMVFQIGGAFRKPDAWVQGLVANALGASEMEIPPVLIELDDAVVERWGAPPWGVQRWRQLADALARAGIRTAYLVSPPTRAVRVDDDDRAPASAPMEILVPSLFHLDRELSVSQLDQPRSPLTPWRHHLLLPLDDDGTLRSAAPPSNVPRMARIWKGPSALYRPVPEDELNQSAFCVWAHRCPATDAMAQPILAFDRRPFLSLSAATLLDQTAPIELTAGQTVFIGITSPWYTEQVRIEPAGKTVTYPQAVALALIAAMQDPIVVPHWSIQLLFLVSWVALSFLVQRRIGVSDERTSLLAAPAVGLVVVIGAYALHLGRLPIVATAVVSGLPPAVAILTNQGAIRHFLHAAMRIIVHAGFRHTPSAALIRSHDQLVVKLGGLTRCYFDTDQCFWLRVKADGNGLEFGGGYHLDTSMFRIQLDDIDSPPFSQALSNYPAGCEVEDMLEGELPHARLMPIVVEDGTLGFWGVPYADTANIPSRHTAICLGRWLAPRIQINLPAAKKRRARMPLGSRMLRDLGALRDLLNTTSEERKQQAETINALPAPVLVTDVSGMILYINEALASLFAQNEVGVIATLREVFFRFEQDEERALGMIQRVFRHLSSVTFAWNDIRGRSYQISVRPVMGEGPNAELSDLLGFVAVFVDVSLPKQLRQVQASVYDFVTNHVRNRLMVAGGYTEILAATATDPTSQQLLAELGNAVADITEVMDQITEAVSIEEDLDRKLPIDPLTILSEVLEDIAARGDQRGLHIECALPDMAQSVNLAPVPAQEALRAILNLACDDAPEGSTVRVNLDEYQDLTTLTIRWEGLGLDETALENLMSDELESGDTPTAAERAVQMARQAFTAVELDGQPGGGLRVTVQAQRA